MDNDITTLFPNGLRIIVVDNDEQTLRDLVQKLIIFRYKVTACSKASCALKVLKNAEERIDLLITEVRMPDIDGFSLLQHVKMEFNIPVIRGHDLAVECLVAGATFYHQKPMNLSTIGTIWQHVTLVGPMTPPSTIVERTTKDEQDDEEEEDSIKIDTKVERKKQKVSWNHELHMQFLDAVDRLGIKQATPKKILQLMGQQDMMRSHIASHLQKYRKYLKGKDLNNQNRSIRSCFWLHKMERSSILDSGPKDIMKKHKLELGISDRKDITNVKVLQSHMSLLLSQMMNLEQVNMYQQRKLLGQGKIVYDTPIKKSLFGVLNIESIDHPITNLQSIILNSIENVNTLPTLSISKGHGSDSILNARNIDIVAENSQPQNLMQDSNYVGLQLHSYTGELGLIQGMSINVPVGDENINLLQNQSQLHKNVTHTINEQHSISESCPKVDVLDTLEDSSWETILKHLHDTQ